MAFGRLAVAVDNVLLPQQHSIYEHWDSVNLESTLS